MYTVNMSMYTIYIYIHTHTDTLHYIHITMCVATYL